MDERIAGWCEGLKQWDDSMGEQDGVGCGIWNEGSEGGEGTGEELERLVITHTC